MSGLSTVAAACVRALGAYDVRRHFDHVAALPKHVTDAMTPQGRAALDAELESRVAVARAAKVASFEPPPEEVFGQHRFRGRTEAEQRRLEASRRLRNLRLAREGTRRQPVRGICG